MTNRSVFPQAVDSFNELSELLNSDKVNYERYQVLTLKSNRTPSEDSELLNLKTILGNKIVSAESFNKLQDCIVNLEDFFLNDIISYMNTLDTGALRTDLGYTEDLNTTDKSSVVNAVNELKSLKADKSVVQMSKITSDNGSSKINVTSGDVLNEIIKAGVGFHTIYAASGTVNSPTSNPIRGIVQLTSLSQGWVYVQDTLGVSYTNYYNSHTWRGWKRLVANTDTQDTLWLGATLMIGSTTITPAKKLSQCRNGWILVWSDYNPGEGSNDYDFNYTYIPKYATTYNGSMHIFPIGSYMTDSTITNVAKKIRVYDDKLTGDDVNDSSTTTANDVCLRYVLEF